LPASPWVTHFAGCCANACHAIPSQKPRPIPLQAARIHFYAEFFKSRGIDPAGPDGELRPSGAVKTKSRKGSKKEENLDPLGDPVQLLSSRLKRPVFSIPPVILAFCVDKSAKNCRWRITV
jgi:hypothetical protein